MQGEHNDTNKPYILYVDDEADNLEVFCSIFKQNYNIVTSGLATEALEIIEKYPFKVILSDQRMPKMSGIEFFTIIGEKFPDIIRILITAFTDFDTLKRAINLGHIYSYINKPYNIDSLKIMLDRAIESFDLQARNKELLLTLHKKNEELTESEERFKHITQSVTDYIYKVFFENGVPCKVIHTAGCEVITGYNIEEFESKPSLWTDIIHPDDKKTFNLNFRRIIEEQHQNTIEYRIVKKNREITWISNTIVLFRDENQKIYAYNGVIKDITYRKQFQQKLVETIIETEEKERRRLAGDLHDELGPQLATMRIYASSLKKRTQKPENLEILDELMEIIKKSVTIVREISNNLSPHILENYGLTAAINSEIEDKRPFFSIGFVNNTEDLRFEKKIETTIYRAVKELLNNTMKYASANRVEINMDFNENFLNLTYADDGKGFNYSELMSKGNKGLGLFNIQSRVDSVKGKCEIESSPGQGFNLTLTIPATIINSD